MRRLWMTTLVAGVGLLVVALLGCGTPGSGASKTEVRELPPFTAISVSGAFELEVARGAPQRVELVGDDNLMDRYRTTVSGETLGVRTEGSVRPKVGPTLRVTLPALTKLEISGAVSGRLKDLAGERLTVDISGAATLTLSGAVTHLDLDMSGASKLHAETLEARHVKVSASGAGSYDVHATETLDVSVSGAATVRYRGQPNLTKDVSGVGKVAPL